MKLVSIIADYLTIISFVSGAVVVGGASVSKKIRKWIKSIVLECLHESSNNEENAPGDDQNPKPYS